MRYSEPPWPFYGFPVQAAVILVFLVTFALIALAKAFVVAACILLAVVAFLLGSIPWGLIISKNVYHTDIREHGSGNIGTTNAMRTMGKKGGVAVFLLDFGKGLLSGGVALFCHYAFVVQAEGSTFIGAFQVDLAFMVSLAFICCTLGHIFSPWLGFKGGKGIAVAVGCLFITFGPVWALVEIAVFAVLVAATRMVSVGSIAAALACPFIAAYLFLIRVNEPVAWVLCTICALVVIWAHRGNIGRIARGEERRIGGKKEGSAA